MISDTEVFVNKYISVPKDMGQLNCAAFVAGIVKGILEGAGFPARWVAGAVCVCCSALSTAGQNSSCVAQGHRPLCTCQRHGEAEDDYPDEIRVWSSGPREQDAGRLSITYSPTPLQACLWPTQRYAA